MSSGSRNVRDSTKIISEEGDVYVVFIFVGGSLVFGETAKYSFNAFIFFLFRFMFYFSLPFKDLFKKTNNIIKQVAFKSAIDYKGALCHTHRTAVLSLS